MENKQYALLLSAIGVPYSVSGKIDSHILPEKALCKASPLFHEDAKACSLTYTLLKNNFDLFDDAILSKEIKLINDKLAVAILGGILYKSNKNHFKKSIDTSIELASEAKKLRVKTPLRLLADFGQAPYDKALLSLYGLKMNEIEQVDIKKTLPRDTLVSRNLHFAKRMQNQPKNFSKSESIDFSNSLKNTLCDKLIEIINRNNLKQVDVAKLIDASPAQVNEIMKKKLERVSIDFLVKKTEHLVNQLKVNHIASEEVNIDFIIRPSIDI